MTDARVIVVGAGVMGAATAWQLGRRGIPTILLEQFRVGHDRGASHGTSRNFNVSYGDAGYLAWLREARVLWRVLEHEVRAPLITRTGIVSHGSGLDLVALTTAVRAGGFDARLLDVREAQRRWPGFRFETPVLHTPEAGRIDADAAVRGFVAAARATAVEVREGVRVASVSADERGASVVLRDEEGERTLTAERVVVTAGAWTRGLLPESIALPPLRVTQEQPAFFAPIAPAEETWPGFNHIADSSGETGWFPTGVYGMATPGLGIKAGWHAAGPVVDPDERSFVPDPSLTEALRRYAREWLPGVDADRFSEVTCTYTSTPDASFVLERFDRVVVGAGFSGHGFKFAPVIGRILADLAELG
ncbi:MULTISPECIES: FAD-dependent oxidoreductase [Microbacterium]|uniref:FAD-dependent oxidoreductase n=4 Tax=Bacteria TaxID=2 RepID=UPI000A51D18A|nr:MULTISPECIES: FAD-dependent oxidoreductase [unclassified Microbacterium]MCK9914842.1 FAD-dependent oxidoreductase [Microbacteriaceae bacterium K1510]